MKRRIPFPGSRVVTRGHGVDRYPCFMLPPGKTGYVSRVLATPKHGDMEVWVKMDEPFKGGKEWDNEVQVWECTEAGIVDYFYSEFEVLELPWWRKVLLRWT